MGILLSLKNSYLRFYNYRPTLCKNMGRDHTQLHDRAAPLPTFSTK